MSNLPAIDTLIAKVRAAGIELPPGRVRADGYGDSPELSEELITLIRAGGKRGGTSLLWALQADGEKLPALGDIEIVVDHRFEPVLVVRITRVEVVAFSAVSAEFAASEGEGDRSLASWRKDHWAFFGRECKRIGREASDSMLCVCSNFEVLNVL
jgi:uncharacterized protein YhfF